MIKSIYREANKPEPIESLKGSLVKWGENNLYPQFLNGLVADNPVHGGIIGQKIKFITSGGLEGEKEILNQVFDGYSLEEIAEQMAQDFEISEMMAIKYNYSPLLKKWSPEQIDYELLRADESGEFYHYSEDWTAQPSKKVGYKKIPDIQYVDIEEGDRECIAVYMTRPKQRIIDDKGKSKITKNYYPTVGYSGGITDILSGIEMSYFTFSEVINGWKGGTLINLSNGFIEDQEKRKELEHDLKSIATQRNKQGGLVITYSDGKEREPTVSQINGTDLDKRYEVAKRQCRDSIMVAHGVISPSLFGVFSETIFGSKEEMETAFELFKENYVKKRQKCITDLINWSWNILNGEKINLKYKEYIPSFLKTKEQTDIIENDEEIYNEFRKRGVKKTSKKIVYSSSFDGKRDDNTFIGNFFKKRFANGLKDIEQSVLSLINNGDPFSTIRRKLNIQSRTLNNIIIRLEENGYIDDWELTEKGKQNIVVERDVTVMYSYETRRDVPAVKTSSREYCIFMMEENKLYTREEIDQISSIVGRDVWQYRGGWYNNPETGVRTPYCRHEWQQHIVIR